MTDGSDACVSGAARVWISDVDLDLDVWIWFNDKHEMIVMAPYHITVPIRIQDDVFKLLASFLIGGPLQPLC